jgi:predicted NBD/HSP70 family sugar kinase
MPKGSNSSRLRRSNEQLLLSSLRRLGAASKAELAHLANLSPQAATRIIDDLEQAELVRRQGLRTGGLGQPSMLYAINPRGAYAIGVNVGWRDVQILLMDFGGTIMERVSHEIEWPEPDLLLDQIGRAIKDLSARLAPAEAARLVGVGVVIPRFRGAQAASLKSSEALAQPWDNIDFVSGVGKRTHLPVFFESDCAAPIVAELLFGQGIDFANLLYAFVGTSVRGGLVLQGKLASGVHGNTGTLASMPVPPSTLASSRVANQPFETLDDRVSTLVLLRHMNANGYPIQSVSVLLDLPPEAQELIDEWVADCAEALTFAIVSVTGVLDFDAIVIDGNLPRPLVGSIVASTQQILRQLAPGGMLVPRILEGKVGPEAPAIGSAALPFYAKFFLPKPSC